MIILVTGNNNIAAGSNRNIQEPVEVDITDNIETVKIKITLVYTELDPSKFTLSCMSIKCQDH